MIPSWKERAHERHRRSGYRYRHRDPSQGGLQDRHREHGPDTAGRTPRNIQLLHDLVDEINDLRPESVIGHYRIWPSGQVNRLTAGWNLTGEDVKGKTRYGGWDPERDTYMRINEDGDFEGLDQTGADRLVWNHREDIIAAASWTPIGMACIDRIERMAYLDDDPIRDAPANMTIEVLNGSLPPADPMIHPVSAPVDSGLGI